MNTSIQNRTRTANSGWTLKELLLVIAVVVILLGFILPPPTHAKARALRIKCASNLKYLDVAFRDWEGEHNEQYPVEVLTNKTGGPLYSDSKDLFRYFQVMSNELSNPQILTCPADKERSPATNLTTDFNSHLSYFLGLDSDEKYPRAFLAGDSNVTNGSGPLNGLVDLFTNQTIGWNQERHNIVGNVAMADGSVQQWSSSAFNDALKHTGLATNRLLFPPEITR